MATKLALTGLLDASPFTTTGQGAKFLANFDVRMNLQHELATDFELTVDTAVVVPFGALDEVNVVYILAVGGKVRVRVTSSDGTTQSIPCDPYCLLISNSVGITALDVTRLAATPTTVTVFIAKKS